MKKMLFLFFCFFCAKSAMAQKAGLETRNIVNFFYSYERGNDSAIDLLFKNVDTLLNSVTMPDILPKGTNIQKQVTLSTVVMYKANGENFAYQKSYTIGKTATMVFIDEQYPVAIGALFEGYSNQHNLVETINRFLETTTNGYLLGKRMKYKKD